MKKFNLHTLLREPLLHFLLIGAALFILYGIQNQGFDDEAKRIIISEADVNRLQAIWNKKWQRPPTTDELNGMIEQQIREEVMYREALAMGLDQNDSIVRRRLAQKVEFISADLAAQIEPSDAQLADYLSAHADKFERPALLSFVHIYFSADRRGEQAKHDALRLLAELKHGAPKVDINSAGDSFMLGQQHQQITEHELSSLFGKDFAGRVFSLATDSWQGPVQSSFGFHIIRINRKTAAKQSELETVRDKVRNEWFAQQRRTMDEAFYQSLRQRYQISVENNSRKQILTSKQQ